MAVVRPLWSVSFQPVECARGGGEVRQDDDFVAGVGAVGVDQGVSDVDVGVDGRRSVGWPMTR